jgi:CheY-like chemotaxis protein/DNA-binding CsgD family transcriptional regulator
MSSINILVVDDSPTTGNLIKLHLLKLGYAVAGIAATAEEALLWLEQQLPDLVLMDINLGEGINGIDAADIIMNKYAIPVIYVTAYSDEKTLEAAKQSMPYGFINKPFRSKDLKVNIEIALTRSSAGKQDQSRTIPPSVMETGRGNIEYAVLSEALDHLVSGVVMINEDLQVYYCNRSADKILGHNFPLNIRDRHLICNSPGIRRDLIKSVREKTSTVFTLHHQASSLHFLVFPLTSRLADDTKDAHGSVLFLFDTVNDAHRIEDVVRTLYKLSPTEAKIASQLVFNPYLADVSVTMGITYHTARTHLKRIYQKTETNKLPALIQKIVTGPAGLLIHSLD